jgi:hypothetical protein
MKKIKCLFFGHNLITKSCPVTDAKSVFCSSCGHGKSHNKEGMSFK